MGSTSWTFEQTEAISQRDCNLLVAAAAGAGKTAVLVERIIKKITDPVKPVDIDRLLVVTFTNAAATEMRERIGRALEEALEREPASPLLQKQMSLVDRASIMTIHSFCLEVVRNNFHTLDIDPSFRITDETEAALMKLDALEELFEEMYETGDEDFLRLADCYGSGKDDSGLKELVLDTYDFIQSHPWPEEWLEEHTEEFNLPTDTELVNTRWGTLLTKGLRTELEGLVVLLERARAVAAESDGLAPYITCIDDDLRQAGLLLDALRSRDIKWDSLYLSFCGYQPSKLPRCGKDADPAAQEKVKAIRKEVKDHLKAICEGIINSTSRDIREDLQRLHPLFKYLAALVNALGSKYSARKKDKALLDFNDLEHHCLKVLVGGDGPSDAALELRERYEEILIDEYQDSNLIQEYILKTISGNDEGRHNVFMVGDVKQSIYRFRQARPELFLSKYQSFPVGAGCDNRKILLSKNFRSRKEVVNAVNFVFRQIMSEEVGELDYTDDEALYPGASYEPAEDEEAVDRSVEVNIIDLSDGLDINSGKASAEGAEKPDAAAAMPDGISNSSDDAAIGDNSGADGQEGEEQLDAIQAEARIVAARIRQLVDGSGGNGEGGGGGDGGSAGSGRALPYRVYDSRNKVYRKAEYKDIVILMRTTRNWAGVFSEELGLQGIPVYADTGSGYFKTVEVQTVLSLLEIIDNPLQDIPLLAVLRSPIGLFTADELVDIRLVDRKLSFYDALVRYSAEYTGETAQKASKFLQALAQWRNKALYLSTDELIWYLYTETSYYSYVGILPGGVQRRANLRILFERARQYEETSYKGLFNFINFINRLKSGGGDMGSAKVLGENENVVRIMSIHKSKGLEFPIVILSGCGKRFNLQDANARVLLHQDLGFGPDVVDPERRLVYPSVMKQAIKFRLKLETLSEEMRILYVAFTRAREKLIVTGSTRDFAKAAARWCESSGNTEARLPAFEMQKALCLLDWIMPALARHRDGALLRQYHNGGALMLEDPSSWEITACNMSEAGRYGREISKVREEVKEYLEDMSDSDKKTSEADDNVSDETEQIRNEIVRRLEWDYPYKRLSEIPAKLSVTELKRRLSMLPDEEGNSTSAYAPPLVRRPAFMDGDRGFSAAESGTVMHFVMQHLDLKAVSKVFLDRAALTEEITNQMGQMVKNELLSRQEAGFVRIDRIMAFFGSRLGMRMLNAGSVYREVPFNMELKASEVYELPEECREETMLLQGVIDCFFEEDGGLVLLDYKTDFVPEGGMDILKTRYRAQLDYYARALESITDKKVTEKYIYLFYNGETIAY